MKSRRRVWRIKLQCSPTPPRTSHTFCQNHRWSSHRQQRSSTATKRYPNEATCRIASTTRSRRAARTFSAQTTSSAMASARSRRWMAAWERKRWAWRIWTTTMSSMMRQREMAAAAASMTLPGGEKTFSWITSLSVSQRVFIRLHWQRVH